MLIAQIPDPSTVIKAASDAGWTNGVVVLILICFLLAGGFIGRWVLKQMDARQTESVEREKQQRIEFLAREDKLSTRLAELENFARTTLSRMIENYAILLMDNKSAYNKLAEALDKRLCLMQEDHQVKIIDVIADAVGDRVVATIHAKVMKP
jgi:hypothetical protein